MLINGYKYIETQFFTIKFLKIQLILNQSKLNVKHAIFKHQVHATII